MIIVFTMLVLITLTEGDLDIKSSYVRQSHLYAHDRNTAWPTRTIQDSLQAFASSIAGLLSSRAVLEGIGIGNSSATPQDALFLSILQETASRIATILFAHRFGTAIEPECKFYRLLADVLNDVAMILDCLSPAFPKHLRVGLIVGAGVLRALCGVAAGSAKGVSDTIHALMW